MCERVILVKSVTDLKRVEEKGCPYGAASAEGRTLGAVDVINLDVLEGSMMLVEPKVVLVEISLIALKILSAVDLDSVNLNVS